MRYLRLLVNVLQSLSLDFYTRYDSTIVSLHDTQALLRDKAMFVAGIVDTFGTVCQSMILETFFPSPCDPLIRINVMDTFGFDPCMASDPHSPPPVPVPVDVKEPPSVPTLTDSVDGTPTPTSVSSPSTSFGRPRRRDSNVVLGFLQRFLSSRHEHPYLPSALASTYESGPEYPQHLSMRERRLKIERTHLIAAHEADILHFVMLETAKRVNSMSRKFDKMITKTRGIAWSWGVVESRRQPPPPPKSQSPIHPLAKYPDFRHEGVIMRDSVWDMYEPTLEDLFRHSWFRSQSYIWPFVLRPQWWMPILYLGYIVVSILLAELFLLVAYKVMRERERRRTVRSNDSTQSPSTEHETEPSTTPDSSDSAPSSLTEETIGDGVEAP